MHMHCAVPSHAPHLLSLTSTTYSSPSLSAHLTAWLRPRPAGLCLTPSMSTSSVKAPPVMGSVLLCHQPPALFCTRSHSLVKSSTTGAPSHPLINTRCSIALPHQPLGHQLHGAPSHFLMRRSLAHPHHMGTPSPSGCPSSWAPPSSLDMAHAADVQ